MKFSPDEKYTTIAAYVIIVALVTMLFVIIGLNIAGIGGMIGKFVDIIKPIIYGFIFAFLLHPLVSMFDRLVFAKVNKSKPLSKLRRGLSIFCAYLLAAVFLMLFGFIIVPSAAQNYNDFFSRIAEYVGVVQGWLTALADNSELFKDQLAKVSELLNELLVNSYKLLNTVTPYALNLIGRVVTETKNIGIGLIISVYFLISKESLAAAVKRILRAVLPDKLYDWILHVGQLSYVTFSEFVVGETLDSILMGMILFTLMSILGMPYASFISLLVGVTFFIPSIGGYIGAIPSTLIILIAAPSKAVWFLIIIIGLQLFDCLLIEPKILSEQNSMSALWVLIAIVVMSGLLGFWGLIIGVPLFIVIRTLIKEALEKRLASKGLDISTSAYYSSSDDVK